MSSFFIALLVFVNHELNVKEIYAFMFKLVMSPGIPEPEFFQYPKNRTRLFKFREFPYPPEPDFFRTLPITNTQAKIIHH